MKWSIFWNKIRDFHSKSSSKIQYSIFSKILRSRTGPSHVLTKSFWFFKFQMILFRDRHFFLKSLCKIYTIIIIIFF